MAGIELLTLQFVSSCDTSATVLLDLNNRSPLFITADGWSAPPPQKQVTAFRSSSRNGANVAQESFDDRELLIKVGIASSTQDEAAEQIQAIGRLLNSEQWLRYQPGTIEPVWFRCRPGEIESIEEFNGQADGTRVLSLRIPAEYAAYGAAVTGTATIANDPTAANGMVYTFPDVQGDVATPLWLSYMQPAGSHHPMIASLSDADVTGLPKRIDINTGTMPASLGFGSTISSVVDASFVNSNLRHVANGGVATLGVQNVWVGNMTFRPGDYRVLIRAKQSTTDRWNVTIGLDGGLYGFRAIDKRLPSTTLASWFDLGVVRIPLGAPMPSSLRSRPSVPTAISVGVHADFSVGASIDVDEVLFVPIGFDSSAQASYAVFASSVANGADDPRQIVIDGETTMAYTVPQTGDKGSQAVAVAGGFPSVMPGLGNIVHFIPAVGEGAAAIGGTSTITWSYFPRYLYIRPATS